MPPNELTEAEFHKTFVAPMKDVTPTASELVDLWAYADEIIETDFPDAGDWNWHVKHIKESAGAEFQHLLVPVPISNVYLVFVIDVAARSILGHYRLDLGALYGLNAR